MVVSHISLDSPTVALARVADARYDAAPSPAGSIRAALGEVATLLGWDAPGRGPFGAAVPAGARVLVKPNWVLHENRGSWGVEPLVTHASVIRAVVEGLLEGDPAQVVVGDAPLQGCDFARLLAASDIPRWADDLAARDPRFKGTRDFRRTKSVVHDGYKETQRDQRELDHFVLFDLGGDSLLEPITVDGAFRVTMYDPTLLRRTHAPGRHQYLVAREIIEADVVVNLPKLKTHKKAGITCALKNLIGINGNKEFLPHHRVGGSAAGGDCYPGRSTIKRALEHVCDVQNRVDAPLAQRALSIATRALHRAAHLGGDRLGIEGSWSGNDTIWRTCLDLNRILLYGRLDGTLAPTPQRRVLNVVDAVVGGQGDGPLSPQPLPLGLLAGGASSAAIDWIGAILLGYRPELVPITAHAFDRFPWPLTNFGSDAVRVLGALGERSAAALAADPTWTLPTEYPLGWLDSVAPRAGGVGDVRAVSAV